MAGIFPESPAAAGGLIPGDSILLLQGHAVANRIDLYQRLRAERPRCRTAFSGPARRGGRRTVDRGGRGGDLLRLKGELSLDEEPNSRLQILRARQLVGIGSLEGPKADSVAPRDSPQGVSTSDGMGHDLVHVDVGEIVVRVFPEVRRGEEFRIKILACEPEATILVPIDELTQVCRAVPMDRPRDG